MNPQQPAPDITVSMPANLWRAILSVEPLAKETYTDTGIALFNAFGEIHKQTGIGEVSSA